MRITKFLRIAMGLFFFVLFSNLFAWGPHDKITSAALKVLPDAEKIKKTLGEENFNLLSRYSWLGDELAQDLKNFYADDYLFTKVLPHYIEHRMPDVKQGIEPHFRRALQALRTETPYEACIWLGPLLHYVEDMGAPPHAMPIYGPEHGPMENWLKTEMIDITGYTPSLLGKTDEEALKGLMERLEKLSAFSVKRAEKILPLVKKGESERGNVEPLVLECAIETAKVVSDTLYTLFTLGLQGKGEGAGLKGAISFSEFPFHKEKGARIILIDNLKYSKLSGTIPEGELLYLSSTDYTTHTDREGRYELRNLPEGEYRILVERTGSQTKISDPVKLEKGKVVTLNLTLSPTSPPRNFIRNPDFKVYSYSKEMPDWWFKKTSWMFPGEYPTSAIILLPPNTPLRCGAVVKDADTKIHFLFRETLWGNPVETLTVQKGQDISEGILYKTKDKNMFAVVVIETKRPLREAVERVWIAETIVDEKPKMIEKNKLLLPFRFDEGQGNVVKDSAGDYKGNLSGNFSWAEGKTGYAISFNGIDTKLLVPNTEPLNPSQVTLSAWIKTTAKTPGTIVEKWKGNTQPGYRLGYVPPAVNMVICYKGGYKTVYGKTPVNDGQWHRVSGVYNGKWIKIYIDGKEDYSEALERDISEGNNSCITIGYRNEGSGASFFNGLIDEVQIYSGQMSSP